MLHILTSLHLVLCSVAGVKRLPVHHHSADYIFSALLESLGQIKKRVPLKSVLGGVGSDAPLNYCT